MTHNLSDVILRLRLYFERTPMFIAIRHALTLMIPFILLGSFAILCANLPFPNYKAFMLEYFGPHWDTFFVRTYNATFGIMSIVTTINISYLYVSDITKHSKSSADPLIGSILSLSCFIALIGIDGSDFNVSQFGATGLFSAIIITIIALKLYTKASTIKRLSLSLYTEGANPLFSNALKSIFPACVTLLPFLLLGSIIDSLGYDNISQQLSNFQLILFTNAGDTLIAAVLFTLSIQFFWFFGIHGNNMLEYVSQNLYAPAVLNNQAAIMAGEQANQILTKPFFDTFVTIGGSGATLSLLIAIFIWSKSKNVRRHGKMSLIPSLFNINELVLFGLPIVIEPIFLIPFLLVPLILTVTSYLAISIGLVPFTQQEVTWTTPIFLSGFLVTGSIKGSILQLLNLVIGIYIYKPFLKSNEDLAVKRDLNNYSRLLALYKENELSGHSQWLSKRSVETGNIARVIITELEIALKNNELMMHYQPQFNTSNEVIGLESLLRWEHNRYGYIYPPLILSLAEEGELNDALGAWIIDRVIQDTKRLEILGYTTLTNSINLSAVQLESPNVVHYILDQIAKYQLNTKQISIEITEHVALSSNPLIHEALLFLNDSDIKLSMDDFGMGHSSLMYLKSHKFDTIKLDGSLVKDIVNNKISQEIVSSIYYLSQSLNIAILAEFVETSEQRDILAKLGCYQYQGYLFSQALSFDALIEFLEKH